MQRTSARRSGNVVTWMSLVCRRASDANPAIALGFGYQSPALVGAGLAAGGLVIALVSLHLERRSARRTPQLAPACAGVQPA